MKKKIIRIIIIIVPVFLLALFLSWWFSLTPLISRDEIERQLDQTLMISYEFVSSERIQSSNTGRSERPPIHRYYYRDVYGVEFTVDSFKQQESVYASDTGLWWHNKLSCNYLEMFNAKYERDIKDFFENQFIANNANVPRRYHINVCDYEEIVKTADILAMMYAEIPPYPFNRDAYLLLGLGTYLEKIDVCFFYGDSYEYYVYLHSFNLLFEGDVIPQRDYFLEEMEESLAHQIKLASLEEYIDMDTLPQRVLDMVNDED